MCLFSNFTLNCGIEIFIATSVIKGTIFIQFTFLELVLSFTVDIYFGRDKIADKLDNSVKVKRGHVGKLIGKI